MLVNYFSCIVDAVSRIGSNMFSLLTIHVTKSSTVGVFIFLNLCLCSHSVYAEQSQSEQDLLKPMLSMEVGRVVDGDSLYLAGQQRQIRLWGVDAPERNKPGYWSARRALNNLTNNQRLSCFPKELDRYGRIVSRCFLSGDQSGVELNRQLLERGVAKEYCYFSRGFYGFCD